MDEMKDWATENMHLESETSVADDVSLPEVIHDVYLPVSFVEQGASVDSNYRPNQTFVDATLGTVKQYLKFVSDKQFSIRNQMEGMERAFASRLEKFEAELQKEIKAGTLQVDERLQEAKSKMDVDTKAAKEEFEKCRSVAKEDQKKAAQLAADIVQCRKFAEDRDDKENIAKETVANNLPRKQKEQVMQEVVYARLEQIQRSKEKWVAALEEAELKAKSSFNLAAKANTSLRELIETRDRLERQRTERLNELKRAVDEAENVSVGAGVEFAGTVGIAQELSKASDDVLKDAQRNEEVASNLLDIVVDVKGSIDKLYATGTSNLGMTTEEFFDYEDDVFNAFASSPVDVTGVNIDDWKTSFESVRSEKESLLTDIAKQVKDLLDINTESLFANMRSMASNTLFNDEVLPLFDDIQKEVAQAVATQTTAACSWYTDASYGPSDKDSAVVEACASFGAIGGGGASLLQAKAALTAKVGGKARAKTRIVNSPTLAKSLGDLQSVLTSNKLEMQSRRLGVALGTSAKEAAIAEAEAGDKDKQAKAEEQARRQEILDEEKRQYLAWSQEQDEAIAKIDRQLGEMNAAAEEARLDLEKVQKKLKEVQTNLDWHNEADQVEARADSASRAQNNIRQIEAEDARVTSEYIAAVESVKQCAERVLDMSVESAKALGQETVNRTADEKAMQARQNMDAAAQAEKKCKEVFRDTKKQIEMSFSAKQEELKVAKSISDVQRVKLQEYRDALDKCNEDYDNVLALSVQVEEYHVQVLDPYYAFLTSLQTGLGVLFFDALEKDPFERTANTDRLAQKMPLSSSELVRLATTISDAGPAVLSKGNAIKQKLEAWVPAFDFEARSQIQGKMDALLEEVRKTEPMSIMPWCKWYSVYYLKQDTILGYDECLQKLKVSEAAVSEKRDPLANLQATLPAPAPAPAPPGISDPAQHAEPARGQIPQAPNLVLPGAGGKGPGKQPPQAPNLVLPGQGKQPPQAPNLVLPGQVKQPPQAPNLVLPTPGAGGAGKGKQPPQAPNLVLPSPGAGGELNGQHAQQEQNVEKHVRIFDDDVHGQHAQQEQNIEKHVRIFDDDTHGQEAEQDDEIVKRFGQVGEEMLGNQAQQDRKDEKRLRIFDEDAHAQHAHQEGHVEKRHPIFGEDVHGQHAQQEGHVEKRHPIFDEDVHGQHAQQEGHVEKRLRIFGYGQQGQQERNIEKQVQNFGREVHRQHAQQEQHVERRVQHFGGEVHGQHAQYQQNIEKRVQHFGGEVHGQQAEQDQRFRMAPRFEGNVNNQQRQQGLNYAVPQQRFDGNVRAHQPPQPPIPAAQPGGNVQGYQMHQPPAIVMRGGTPVCPQNDQEDDCSPANIRYQRGTHAEITCSSSQPYLIGKTVTIVNSFCDPQTGKRTYEYVWNLNGVQQTPGRVWQSRLRLPRGQPPQQQQPVRVQQVFHQPMQAMQPQQFGMPPQQLGGNMRVQQVQVQQPQGFAMQGGAPVCPQNDREDDCSPVNIKYRTGMQVEITCSTSQPQLIGRIVTIVNSFCDTRVGKRTYEYVFNINGNGVQQTPGRAWQSRVRLPRR